MEFIEINEKSSEKYLTAIARVHYEAYSKEHFTSCFSVTKLEKYYALLIQASDISIIALENDSVVGFIISGKSVSKGVAKFTKLNRGYLLLLLLSHPKFIYQKIRSVALNKIIKTKPSHASFRLLSIAVSSSSQSKGLGSEMLSFFERVLIKRSELSYGLSVRSVNHRAVKFYEKMGFVLEKEVHGSKYFFKKLTGIN